ncbi:MAG: DUF6498-containing protein [Pseudomonadales bacterium]|jgi:hypothetical protein
MLTDQVRRRPLALALLVGLNMVPVVGVFYWGWQSFELIFLYWMENVVIGAFTVGRMVIRPYGHPIDFALPLFFAPFFVFHYGMFCWGHGTFVMGLFGPDTLNNAGVAGAALDVLAMPHMLAALLALASIQALDWIRDVRERGLGADGVKTLMTAPYRRIVVLHVSIIVGGFALLSLDQPTTGLVILVLVKTASDVWHWRTDGGAEATGDGPAVTPEMIAEMAEKYPEPVVTVNGEKKQFASFAEMRDSREFRMAQALMRLVGSRNDLEAMNTYMDMRVRDEGQAA